MRKLIILLWILQAISWIANLVKFIQCDFEPAWKEEIVHGIGVVIPFSSIITVWF